MPATEACTLPAPRPWTDKTREERAFHRGEQLFGAAEPAEQLYILLEGKVKSSLFERGHELAIKEYNPGDHFAKSVLVDGQLCDTWATGTVGGTLIRAS